MPLRTWYKEMIKVLVNGNVSISEYLSRKELLQVIPLFNG